MTDETRSNRHGSNEATSNGAGSNEPTPADPAGDASTDSPAGTAAATTRDTSGAAPGQAGRRRLVVINNPASGDASGQDEIGAAIADDDASSGWHVEFSPTTEDDPGQGQAKDAVESGVDRILVAGGDGTVRAVLESVAGTEVELAVLPLGTGNLLAGNLDIETGTDALPTALGSSTRRLDVADVNGETFAVMAGMGFDAEMIRDADSDTKARFGSIAYVISAARHVRRNRFPGTVTVDGREVWSGSAAMILVGNCGSVTGGLPVFPDADPHDGRLDVAVLSVRSVREWASVLVRLLTKKDQRPDLVQRWTAESVVVESRRDEPWELDGEDRPPTRRLEFSIRPDSLTVVC